MEIPPAPVLCPQCHQPVVSDAYFCPNCGKNLKEKPPSTRWWTQVGIYALSVLLPPLGLWPGVKYLRSGDADARRVGWVAVILTAVSLVASIFLFQALWSQLQGYLSANTAGLLGY